MRRDIILSQEEAHRARVLGEVSIGTMTLREAAVVLRISYRHTRRVHRRYQEEGVAGLAYRRRGEKTEYAARRGHKPGCLECPHRVNSSSAESPSTAHPCIIYG